MILRSGGLHMVRHPCTSNGWRPWGVSVVVGVIALSALPAGSTIVCPTGVKPPSPYCTNVPPIARTDQASRVRGDSATLNGVAGPNVRGGDITQYFFKYGPTPSYGFQTPTGTIGSCPHGIGPPSPYCNVPKKQRVSERVSDLTPCTRYHFQLFADNPDGSAAGGDRTFATGFAPPSRRSRAGRGEEPVERSSDGDAPVRHRPGAESASERSAAAVIHRSAPAGHVHR